MAESRRSEIRLSAIFGLGSGLRFYSPRPFHPFASVIEEGIASEVSLYGVRQPTPVNNSYASVNSAENISRLNDP